MFSIHHLIGQPWAITPEIAELVRNTINADGYAGLRRLAEVRALVGAGKTDKPAAAATSPTAAAGDARSAGGGVGVAILPIMGMITLRGDVIDCMDTTSALEVAAMVRSLANNADVKAIVLEVDSPGGQVLGIQELAAEIRGARAAKPVVASVNGMACSAAYWAAAQATEVIATPSGILGSIGVYQMHTDHSKELEAKGQKVTLVYAGKYKVERNPYGELGAEATSAVQAETDRYYAAFTSDVAKGMGVPVDNVRNGFGQGRTVGSRQAVDTGMAHGVGTLEEAVRRAAQLAREKKRGAATGGSAAALRLETYRRQRG